MPEHGNVDELIRQEAVSYMHIPEDKYSGIKQVVINRNKSKNTIGGVKWVRRKAVMLHL